MSAGRPLQTSTNNEGELSLPFITLVPTPQSYTIPYLITPQHKYLCEAAFELPTYTFITLCVLLLESFMSSYSLISFPLFTLDHTSGTLALKHFQGT